VFFYSYTNFINYFYIPVVIMRPTIVLIEKAIIPTATPATPHKKAAFAVLTFSGAPWAVKNIIPAATKATTTTSVKIIQTAFATLKMIASRLTGDAGRTNCAETRLKGKHDKIKKPKKIKDSIFFLIIYLNVEPK